MKVNQSSIITSTPYYTSPLFSPKLKFHQQINGLASKVLASFNLKPKDQRVKFYNHLKKRESDLTKYLNKEGIRQPKTIEVDKAKTEVLLLTLMKDLKSFWNSLPRDEKFKYMDQIQPAYQQLEMVKPIFLMIGLMESQKKVKRKENLLPLVSEECLNYIKAIPKGESRLFPGNAPVIDKLNLNAGSAASLYNVTRLHEGSYQFKPTSNDSDYQGFMNWLEDYLSPEVFHAFKS